MFELRRWYGRSICFPCSRMKSWNTSRRLCLSIQESCIFRGWYWFVFLTHLRCCLFGRLLRRRHLRLWYRRLQRCCISSSRAFLKRVGCICMKCLVRYFDLVLIRLLLIAQDGYPTPAATSTIKQNFIKQVMGYVSSPFSIESLTRQNKTTPTLPRTRKTIQCHLQRPTRNTLLGYILNLYSYSIKWGTKSTPWSVWFPSWANYTPSNLSSKAVKPYQNILDGTYSTIRFRRVRGDWDQACFVGWGRQ